MSSTPPTQLPSDELARTAKVLFIDDDKQWLKLVVDLLTKDTEDFDVVTAESLAGGKQQFVTDDFDCVVCDYRLGDGTGLELLEEVRSSHSDLPFVIVTSRGDESVAADAISQGVTDYLPKELIREDFDDPETPVLATQLKSVIRQYRTKRALRQERQIKTATLDLLTTMSNQQELYQQFCALLQEDQEYECVWLGTVGAGGRIIPRAVSGGEEYIHALNLSTDKDADQFDPAIRAAIEESVAVSSSNSDHATELWSDEWEAATTGFDFNAGVGIPIGDDRIQFGVLGAYTSNDVITEDQITLLQEFARIITDNIRSDEWRESMVSGESVKLVFEIEAPTEPLINFVSQLPADSTFQVKSVAEHNDGQMLYSVDITGVDENYCEDIVARSDHISLYEATVTTEGHWCTFLVDPPTPESIAREYGLQFEKIEIESGIRRITGYLSTDHAIPNLLADLKSTFEETTVNSVTSTMTTTTNTTPNELTAQILTPLTNRQREILSQAYHEGYFEQPRDTNTTELADRLGIARPTFTQHLRSAQRKLFESILFEEGEKQ